MKMRTLILPVLFAASIAATPSLAVNKPVASYEVNKFIGTTLKGRAMAPLGIVSAADRKSGFLAVAGMHGERAIIHASLLQRSGTRLMAPQLTRADIKRVSGTNRGLIAKPEVIIEEFYDE